MHPYTPFITEELWSFFKIKNENDLIISQWPVVDESAININTDNEMDTETVSEADTEDLSDVEEHDIYEILNDIHLALNHFKDLNQISSISSSPSVNCAINLFFLPIPISLISEISPII